MRKNQPDGQNSLFVFVLTLIIALTISIIPSNKDKEAELSLLEMIPSVTQSHLVSTESDHSAPATEHSQESGAVEADVHKSEAVDTVQVAEAVEEKVTEHAEHVEEAETAKKQETVKEEEAVEQAEHAGEKQAEEHTGAEEEESSTHTEVVQEVQDVEKVEPAQEEVEEEPEAVEEEKESVEQTKVVKEAEAVEESEAAPEAKTAEEAPATPKSTQVADVVAMNSPLYETHKKSIIQFTHKKHIEDYSIGCGECHHDTDGQPLTDLKMGDPVEKCGDCHSKIGKLPKGASAEEKLEYHKEALHQNCIQCHKTFNKENNTKAAPASCKQCHPKNK